MDVFQNGIRVGKAATGEGKKTKTTQRTKSGRARAESLTPEQRSELAKKAAKARWEKQEE